VRSAVQSCATFLSELIAFHTKDVMDCDQAPMIPQNEARFVNELSKSADFIPGLFLLLDKAIVGLRELSSVGATVAVREFAYNYSPAIYYLLNGYASEDLPPYLFPIFHHLLALCEKRMLDIELTHDQRQFTEFPASERKSSYCPKEIYLIINQFILFCFISFFMLFYLIIISKWLLLQ
jgi:hypothetical protein